MLQKFQVYNIVIHNFERLYSIYTYDKILAVFPVLYNISLWLIYFIHSNLYLLIICPYFIPPPFPLPTGNNWFITLNFFIIHLFWLCWVLVAVWAFSSCREQGLLSGCGAQASHCSSFSYCGAPAPEHMRSVVTHGLSCPALWGKSFQTRDRNRVLCIGRQIFNHWITREVQFITF